MIKGMGSTSKILSPFSSAVGTMPLEMGAACTLPPESAASRDIVPPTARYVTSLSASNPMFLITIRDTSPALPPI